MSLVTFPLRCHNSENDAPDHEAADAEYPVVPIFRHVASMRLRPLSPNMGTEGTSESEPGLCATVLVGPQEIRPNR